MNTSTQIFNDKFDVSSSHQDEFTVMAYISAALTAIFLLVIVACFDEFGMQQDIQGSVKSSPCASRSVCRPIASMIAVYRCIILCHELALGSEFWQFELFNNVTVNASKSILSYDTFVQIDYRSGMLAFNFFGFLWNAAFINGLAIVTSSGAVANGTFTPLKVPRSLRRHLRVQCRMPLPPWFHRFWIFSSPSSGFVATWPHI